MKSTCSRLIAAVAIVSLTAFASASAYAAPFTPSIDELWIDKNGGEIFRDSFNGALPLSASTYYYNPAGFTGESGGRLTMTPALGTPTIINPTGTATFTGALLQQGLSSTSPNHLGVSDSFEIHALYDMSSLPQINGEGFGIRATDIGPPGGVGNDTVQLSVGKTSSGDIAVALRDINFSLGTNTLIDFASIQSSLASATQIDLILSKIAGSDMMSASYTIYGSSGILNQSGFGNQVQIYDGEDFTRAQFFSVDLVPVPEPASLALLSLGLAGIGFGRCGKQKLTA